MINACNQIFRNSLEKLRLCFNLLFKLIAGKLALHVLDRNLWLAWLQNSLPFIIFLGHDFEFRIAFERIKKSPYVVVFLLAL